MSDEDAWSEEDNDQIQSDGDDEAIEMWYPETARMRLRHKGFERFVSKIEEYGTGMAWRHNHPEWLLWKAVEKLAESDGGTNREALADAVNYITFAHDTVVVNNDEVFDTEEEDG